MLNLFRLLQAPEGDTSGSSLVSKGSVEAGSKEDPLATTTASSDKVTNTVSGGGVTNTALGGVEDKVTNTVPGGGVTNTAPASGGGVTNTAPASGGGVTNTAPASGGTGGKKNESKEIESKEIELKELKSSSGTALGHEGKKNGSKKGSRSTSGGSALGNPTTTSTSAPPPTVNAGLGSMQVGTEQAPALEELTKEENKQIDYLIKDDLEAQFRRMRESFSEHGEDWISKIMANISNIMRSRMRGAELDQKLENINYIAENKNKASSLSERIADIDKILGGQPPPGPEERVKLEREKAILMEQKETCIKNIKNLVADINDTQQRIRENGGKAKPYHGAKERENIHAKLSLGESIQGGILRVGYAIGSGAVFAGREVPKAALKSLGYCTAAAVKELGAGICWSVGKVTGSEKFNEWSRSCAEGAQHSLSNAKGACADAGKYFKENTWAALSDWYTKPKGKHLPQERAEERAQERAQNRNTNS